MSFGYSTSEAILLAQLILHTLKATRNASTEYDELTRQVSSLTKLLDRVQRDVFDATGSVSQEKAARQKELDEHITACRHLLQSLYLVMTKYSILAASDSESGSDAWERKLPKLWRLWRKLSFGISKPKVLADIRCKLPAYLKAIEITLQLDLRESTSEVEALLRNQSSHTEGLVGTVNLILGKLSSGEDNSRKSFEENTDSMLKKIVCELKKDYPKSDFTDSISSLRAYVEEVRRLGGLENRSNVEHVGSSDAQTPSILEASELSEAEHPEAEHPEAEHHEAEQQEGQSPENDLGVMSQENEDLETLDLISGSGSLSNTSPSLDETSMINSAHIEESDRLSEQLLPDLPEGDSDEWEADSNSSSSGDEDTTQVKSLGSERRFLFPDYGKEWEMCIWRVSGFRPVTHSRRWVDIKNSLRLIMKEELGDGRSFLRHMREIMDIQKWENCRRRTEEKDVLYHNFFRKYHSAVKCPEPEWEMRTSSLYELHTRIRVERLQVCTNCPYYPWNLKAAGNSHPPWTTKFPQWSASHFWNPKLKSLHVNEIAMDGNSFSVWVLLWTELIWGSQSPEMYLAEDFATAVFVLANAIELLSSKRMVRDFLTKNKHLAPVLKEVLKSRDSLWQDLRILLDSAQKYDFYEKHRSRRYGVEMKKGWFGGELQKSKIIKPHDDLIEEMILLNLGIRGTPEWEDTLLFITKTYIWFRTVRSNFKGFLRKT